jgi:O-antigen/teichoic acid export membrane protein
MGAEQLKSLGSPKATTTGHGRRSSARALGSYPVPTIETDSVAGSRRWNLVALGQTILNEGREYASTFATQFADLGCQLLVYKLAAHYFGKQGFSEYAVARRAISTIYPVCLLGLGVALPRFIALSAADEQGAVRDRFWGASLWCVGFMVLFMTLLLNMMASKFAFLIYGASSYRPLVFPIMLVIAGLSLHALVYGYFRGHLQMNRANLLQIINSGIVPLVVLLWGSRGVGPALEEIGALTLLVAALGLLFTPWQKFATNCTSEVRTLLCYGLPRVPGDFALIALLGLPAFLVAHEVGVQEAGYVAFGMSVLGMIGAVFAPIGLVLLPKASGFIARGAHEALRSHVSAIMQLSLAVSALLTFSIEISAGTALRIYLGSEFSGLATIVRVVMLGAVPYAVFSALRSAVDARHFRPINARNCMTALAILASCSALLAIGHDKSVLLLILPLPLSLLVLGILTWSESRKLVEA